MNNDPVYVAALNWLESELVKRVNGFRSMQPQTNNREVCIKFHHEHIDLTDIEAVEAVVKEMYYIDQPFTAYVWYNPSSREIGLYVTISRDFLKDLS